MAGLKVITPPAVEPVMLNEIKPQLRIELDDTSYDDILTPLVISAREWCEGYQNRAYVTQTLELALDFWPCGHGIDLPRPPIQSVTSLVFEDTDGVSNIWEPTNYEVDDYSYVPRLVKRKLVSWPIACLASANGVKVRYVAGYGDTGEQVPQRIKQAITLLVSHWFENGMSDPPAAVLALLNMDRVVPI